MLKLIKTILNRQEISLTGSKKMNHYIEIYLQYGYSVEKIEFQIEQRNPEFVLEGLRQCIKEFDRCVKFRFIDRMETNKNGVIEVGKPMNHSGNYYFGKRLTMSEVSAINTNRGIYDNIITFDEYQIGGVFHKRSCLVSPLFTNDIVIDNKFELEQEQENFKEEQMLLKKSIR